MAASIKVRSRRRRGTRAEAALCDVRARKDTLDRSVVHPTEDSAKVSPYLPPYRSVPMPRGGEKAVRRVGKVELSSQLGCPQASFEAARGDVGRCDEAFPRARGAHARSVAGMKERRGEEPQRPIDRASAPTKSFCCRNTCARRDRFRAPWDRVPPFGVTVNNLCLATLDPTGQGCARSSWKEGAANTDIVANGKKRSDWTYWASPRVRRAGGVPRSRRELIPAARSQSMELIRSLLNPPSTAPSNDY